jgi:hypothetical protein
MKPSSKQRFNCGCGKQHTIGSCAVIQTHWYTPPRGCCEGDYWNTGELQIVCPTTGVRNRVMFEFRTEIDWMERNKFKNDPEQQFSFNYKKLFKEVKDVYEDHTVSSLGGTVNNFYFDKHHKRFGIKIG